MSILSKEEIERIQLAEVDFKASAHEYEATLRLLIKPGMVVYWRTRGYLQRGIVNRFIGNAHFPDMFVENNRTGKTVKVNMCYVDWHRMLNQAKDFAELVKTINQGAAKELNNGS